TSFPDLSKKSAKYWQKNSRRQNQSGNLGQNTCSEFQTALIKWAATKQSSSGPLSFSMFLRIPKAREWDTAFVYFFSRINFTTNCVKMPQSQLYQVKNRKWHVTCSK